ncbi:MAG: rod shape-determining protein RodA [Flavobacteriaceae bacterium]|jgi:rod shape determining protein RodA|nr:rod shape-determining protein RodA [Flavobacteriaceae bacterium]MDA7848792.1 rod shape-determining protein RodA [Flavobacteriaceae bacterium]MDB0004089.1 rod shape-determining protein RodA [Flavobacteriaceae bacterium]MDG1309765.1 rod shape-determining protein RodA [Flavobacteriaceae bacterium]
MNLNRTNSFQLDWIAVIVFTALVVFGYFNILSASAAGEFTSYLDISKPYGKQLFFIISSVVLIVLILAVDAKFYERFASIIYLGSILSLIGLFIFGKQINGAISWYDFGGMTLQPSEFAKFATALALAKYISDLQTNIKEQKDQIRAAILVGIPAGLILLQNDAGSTLVFASLFFVFYREGIPQYYLLFTVYVAFLGIATLKFSALYVCISLAGILLLYQLFFKRKKKKIRGILTLLICSIGLSLGVQWAYNNVLQKHQQNRIGLWLRLEKDPLKLEAMKRNISYNLNESEKAIRSGGTFGKGFMDGTRTKGNFVPEQHTDYIFSTVGEEWGFFGSSAVVLLFVLLILRIVYLSEQQKSQFSRVYGYSVASILFAHFLINIGMVMGLIPTIGIPLPFFSYGGSGLWGFTILVFIFLKLDSNRLNEW